MVLYRQVSAACEKIYTIMAEVIIIIIIIIIMFRKD